VKLLENSLSVNCYLTENKSLILLHYYGAEKSDTTLMHILEDNCLPVSLFIRYSRGMAFFNPVRERPQVVVRCKGCLRDVPAGVLETPKTYIAVKCILCGEHRRYLPTEVGAGVPHYEALKRMRGQKVFRG
jgi:hypothetical protein